MSLSHSSNTDMPCLGKKKLFKWLFPKISHFAICSSKIDSNRLLFGIILTPVGWVILRVGELIRNCQILLKMSHGRVYWLKQVLNALLKHFQRRCLNVIFFFDDQLVNWTKCFNKNYSHVWEVKTRMNDISLYGAAELALYSSLIKSASDLKECLRLFSCTTCFISTKKRCYFWMVLVGCFYNMYFS